MSDWVDRIDSLAEEALRATGSTAIRPIYGGLFGAVILVHFEDQRRVLKLFPLEKATLGQIDALEKMHGNGCPAVYAADRDRGWVLLEEIADNLPSDELVDLEQAYQAISKIWAAPLSAYQLTYLDMFNFWFEIHGTASPADLLTAIKRARQLIGQAPASELTHIHADIGVHNLMRRSSGEMIFIDPSGALGPPAVDLGALGAWGGAARVESLNNALRLAEIAGVDPLEPARWAVVSIIADANMCHSRGDADQRRECLSAAKILLDQFDDLQK